MDLETMKTNIGKLFFIISVLALIAMFILSLTGVYIFIDERFTIYLINLPLSKAISLCIMDVHPPLYYIILKIPCYILSALGISYNPVIVCRIVSILPYLIILLYSVTKLRKEYGWFVIGIFTFTLATMSAFFMQFLIMRMYNWGLLFLLFSFIYLKDVIYKSDGKSWILFTLFTILGAYTHYLLLVTSVILYLGLLIYYFLNKYHGEIKKWFASAIAVFLVYIPWILIFLSQFLKEEGKGSPVVPNLSTIIHDFTYYALKTSAINTIAGIFEALAIALLILVILGIFINYYDKKDKCNSYLLIGIITPILSIIGIAVLFMLTTRTIAIRYLVPIFSILWLTIAIYMGKIENTRLLAILLMSVVLLAGFNVIDTASTLSDDFARGYQELDVIDEINNPDSIVVYGHRFSYTMYSDDLNETEAYTTKYVNALPYDYDVVSTNLTGDDIKDLAKENPDKHVYKIGPVKNKKKVDEKDIMFARGKWLIVKVS